MAVNVVAVDNAPELLEKIEGIFRNMAEVSLLGSFEEAVAVVEFVKENPVLMSSIPGFSLEAWKIQAYGFIEKPYTKQDIMKMVERYRRESENGVDGSF